ncbi:MAG: HAMP domain-containing histidine kinase [Acidobacteria bacterium]|nr:HAMP domain-containing histidine kinase [Acidobacteriota bacterium]
MKNEIASGPMMVLCHTDGRIIATNQPFISFAGFPDLSAVENSTIAELARRIDCLELQSRFVTFIESEKHSESFPIRCSGGAYQATLQMLDDLEQEHLILIGLDHQALARERRYLLEAGRMTSRLIHDFKNQMGGLKLYAAYLKKRFADQPEGLEIAEKIIQGLNTMAEQASLISKLTRPLDLKHEPVDPASFFSQAISDQTMRAEARKVKIEAEIENGLPGASLDIQHLRTALGSIITRAIDSSPEGGIVRIKVQSRPGEMQIEIVNQGEMLSEQQRETLFDLQTGDRIKNSSLELALARRIIEEHSGRVIALAASTQGTIVQVVLPI